MKIMITVFFTLFVVTHTVGNEKTIADYTKTIKTSSDGYDKADAYFNRGIAYAEQQRYTEAIADYSDAIRLLRDGDSYKAFVYKSRAESYGMQEDYRLAVLDYDRSIALQEDDEVKALTYCLRGLAYSGLGNYTKALADCTLALNLSNHEGFKKRIREGIKRIQYLLKQ